MQHQSPWTRLVTVFGQKVAASRDFCRPPSREFNEEFVHLLEVSRNARTHRAHVCAGWGRNAPFSSCGCVSRAEPQDSDRKQPPTVPTRTHQDGDANSSEKSLLVQQRPFLQAQTLDSSPLFPPAVSHPPHFLLLVLRSTKNDHFAALFIVPPSSTWSSGKTF